MSDRFKEILVIIVVISISVIAIPWSYDQHFGRITRLEKRVTDLEIEAGKVTP